LSSDDGLLERSTECFSDSATFAALRAEPPFLSDCKTCTCVCVIAVAQRKERLSVHNVNFRKVGLVAVCAMEAKACNTSRDTGNLLQQQEVLQHILGFIGSKEYLYELGG
jgi:hypothetical protein